MASTTAFKGHAKIIPNERETPFSTPIRPSSRPSTSLSSSPSFSSNSSFGSIFFPDDSPFSPSTPFRSSGIPFSWEKLPGIPKNQIPNKKAPNQNFLPLPPAGNPIPSTKATTPIPKKYISDRNDPFFTALVECSKDDHDTIGNFWKVSRATRTLSDRFGFMSMYTSCKSTCAVSESIVFLPKSSRHDLFGRR